MFKIILTFFVTLSLLYSQSKLNYPVTKKIEQKDNYFGIIVEDPYRWLEDINSEETKKWVEEQNKLTFSYLEKIPFREKIKNRITELYNYPKYSAPFKGGNNYFFYKNTGLQNQSVLYIQSSLEAEPEIFLDPNKFSEDGTIALSNLSISRDGRYLAYSISKSGSDWQEIFVMDVENRSLLDDNIKWVKFSGISWYKDGFFYSRYDQPDSKELLLKSNQFHKVYYHKVGTKQEDDQLVFYDSLNPKRNFGISVTKDEKYAILYLSEGASGKNAFFIKALEKNSDFIEVVTKFDAQYSVIDNIENGLLVLTNKNAPNKKIILVDINNPDFDKGKEIIPEKDYFLQSAQNIGNKLLVTYLKDASSHSYIYSLKGELESEIKFPGIGSVSGFTGDKYDSVCFYSFTSFTTPPTIYKLNVNTGESKIFRTTEIDINVNEYLTEQVFYKSKDGTRVPMFITYKKGIKLNGKNPLMLYAYGGFNAVMTPNFSPTRMVFLEKGGIYAVANIRGGSEYGEKWHRDGMRLKKQNVFDDFIAAAEYLIEKKYTSKDKLAINGGSNGGLLVGAVVNQRPELFKVAVPAVGVMDMLRYHKFTIGWSWVEEYGSSDDSTDFMNLYKYSPLHNIKSGLKYPAILVTTGDHDDRVIPAHSYKYIATLQEKYKGKNPVLIRVETKAGHGGGKPTSKIIDEQTDIWSFVFYNLGMKF